MNDACNTQIFTFLILPQLLCGAVEEVDSVPFMYSQHLWIIRLQKSEKHLGAFLELHSPFCGYGSTITNSNLLGVKGQSANPVSWEAVSLDFQFTLKSREHFSQNENFMRRSCVFSGAQSRHGRKHFVELGSLSSKNYLYDDGKFVVELELKNAEAVLNLWAFPCKDPLDTSVCEDTMTKNTFSLMRLDGSVVKIPRSQHFETSHFPYYDSNWFLTLDLEPCQFDPENQSNVDSGLINVEQSKISVRMEISLIRQVHRSRNPNRNLQSAIPGKQQTNTYRVKCSLLLPGNCSTGIMHFFIGSQGWPTQAHRTTFGASNMNGLSANDISCSNTTQQLGEDQCDIFFSGSPVSLLLASASSPMSIRFQIRSFSCITFVEVPMDNEKLLPHPVRLIDPFDLPWNLQTKTSGRILRLQLIPDIPDLLNHGDAQYTTTVHATIKPTSVYMLGVQCQINPLTTQLHDPVRALGTQVTQLLRFSENYMAVNSNRLQSPEESHKGGNAHLKQRRKQLPSISKCEDDAYEVAMNITVDEANEKSSGLVNPLNGTILVELTWIYHHLLCRDRIHTADVTDQKHYIQMRNELNQLRKEKDELERQILMKELGLVQVSVGEQGPKSLLPRESLVVRGRASEQSALEGQLQTMSPKQYQKGRGKSAGPESALKYAEIVEDDYENEMGSRTSLPPYKSRDCLGIRSQPAIQSNYKYRISEGHDSPAQKSFEANDYYGSQSGDGRLGDRSSVKSAHEQTRLPDRRKQFSRSKTTWQTYDNYQDSTTGYSPSYYTNQPSTSWSTPTGRRARRTNLAENPTTRPSAFSPRKFYPEPDDPTIFYRR
ncbi:hypothetical protein P879_03847 [Paragonimus westermani]|uniref:DUF3668 domain-containing protein n=1 Tax=Paragonimus westermani TaxID=34504 RepID=A0A8T0D2R1_9TREM|nr:hypothetical protein P879_03847 [Paragonimus westermani]